MHRVLGAKRNKLNFRIVNQIDAIPYRERHRSYAQQGVLWGMYVKQVYRRRGVGRHLVEELLEIIQSLEGMEQIRLTVLTSNHVAKELYLQFGFVSQSVVEKAFKLKNRHFDEEQMILFLHG